MSDLLPGDLVQKKLDRDVPLYRSPTAGDSIIMLLEPKHLALVVFTFKRISSSMTWALLLVSGRLGWQTDRSLERITFDVR